MCQCTPKPQLRTQTRSFQLAGFQLAGNGQHHCRPTPTSEALRWPVRARDFLSLSRKAFGREQPLTVREDLTAMTPWGIPRTAQTHARHAFAVRACGSPRGVDASRVACGSLRGVDDFSRARRDPNCRCVWVRSAALLWAHGAAVLVGCRRACPAQHQLSLLCAPAFRAASAPARNSFQPSHSNHPIPTVFALHLSLTIFLPVLL